MWRDKGIHWSPDNTIIWSKAINVDIRLDITSYFVVSDMRFETTATSWEEGSTHQLLLVNCVTVMYLAAAELEPVADQIILLLLYSVCYHKHLM